MKSIKPVIDKLGWDDANHAKITMAEVVDYLNDVTQYYGPPCEWCKHFDAICDRDHNPRNYDMMFGPYESFHFVKKCKDYDGIEDDNDSEETKKYVRRALNCFVQQYC
jgi:hypothetical protein